VGREAEPLSQCVGRVGVEEEVGKVAGDERGESQRVAGGWVAGGFEV